MDIDCRSSWPMASADTVIAWKHTMTSWEKQVRRGFVVERAIEELGIEVVSFPHGYCGCLAVLRRQLEISFQVAESLV